MAHERRPKYNRQIPKRHPVRRRVARDPVQMQRDVAQRRVVGVGEIVDQGVERVAAHDGVVDTGGGEELRVVDGGE